jgi:sugar (pentulose or hexulose) kinase
VRAVLEGTAFQLRRLWEALEFHPSGQIGPGELGRPSHVEPAAGAEPRSVPPIRPAAAIVCGGGARSPLWLQILADVTRLELRVPAVVETGALGAAMLGAAAAGLLPLEAARKRMVRPARTHYTPAAAAARRYDELYAGYCLLDDLLAPWFRRAAAAGAATAEGVDGPEGDEGAP